MDEITKELLDALKYAASCLGTDGNDPIDVIIAKAEAILAPAPQPSADGWIPWNGGDCPVEVGTRVDAKFRDGEKAYNVPAGDCAEDPDSRRASDWSHMESNYDIIAYRVVKP